MRTIKQPLPGFLGLMTQYDPSQVPLGGAIVAQNMAMLEEGRLRRVPGITALGTAPVDMSAQVPLLAFVRGLGGSDYTLAVALGSSVKNIVNLTTGAALTGAALSGSFGQPWTYAFYNQKHIIAGGGNTPKEINAAGTYIALAGTNVPTGNLVQAFLDRLYFADIASEEGIVRYSDVLTTVFPATNLVNTKEISGKVTALAVLAIGTDQVGIDTFLVIAKRNALWLWNEVSKDVISQTIGSESPHTFVNTQVGLIFLGEDGNRFSVFYIPAGVAGEPKDIGRALHDVLNKTTVLSNAVLAYAVEDQGFYKLTFAHTGFTQNNHSEYWLDLRQMALTGDIIWYGPMRRGDIDAMVRTTSRLEFARRANSGANVWFRENTDDTQNFVDMDSGVMTALLDLPLNTEPFDEEKIFEVMELQVAKEANKSGNELVVEVLFEDVSQGNISQPIYDSSSPGISRPLIPLYPAGTLGQAAKSSRVKLTHTLNKRLDILGATVQYLANEDRRVKSRIPS